MENKAWTCSICGLRNTISFFSQKCKACGTKRSGSNQNATLMRQEKAVLRANGRKARKEHGKLDVSRSSISRSSISSSQSSSPPSPLSGPTPQTAPSKKLTPTSPRRHLTEREAETEIREWLERRFLGHHVCTLQKAGWKDMELISSTCHAKVDRARIVDLMDKPGEKLKMRLLLEELHFAPEKFKVTLTFRSSITPPKKIPKRSFSKTRSASLSETKNPSEPYTKESIREGKEDLQEANEIGNNDSDYEDTPPPALPPIPSQKEVWTSPSRTRDEVLADMELSNHSDSEDSPVGEISDDSD